MISKPNLLATEQETSFRQDALNHQHESRKSFRGRHCQSTPTRQAIDDVIAAMNRMDYCEEDIFAVRLSLEETIVNALKHGNQNERFDPSQVPDPTAPENLEQPSGRGLMLMRLYMTSVHFNRRGNCVTLGKNRTAE